MDSVSNNSYRNLAVLITRLNHKEIPSLSWKSQEQKRQEKNFMLNLLIPITVKPFIIRPLYFSARKNEEKERKTLLKFDVTTICRNLTFQYLILKRGRKEHYFFRLEKFYPFL